MPDFIIDYTQIKLVENIPLNNDDLTFIEQACKAYKMSPVVLAFWMFIIMVFLFWFIIDDHNKLKNDDYLFYGIITFCISFVTYSIVRSIKRQNLKNFKKDIDFGKCQLTSVVINRHEGETRESLVFAGPLENNPVILRVDRADFNRYEIGKKVTVTFLKYSKEVLFIAKI